MTYDKLDSLIVAAIGQRRSPLYERGCVAESERLAVLTGREAFRITDARVQALRKAGKIKFVKKNMAKAIVGGWKVVEAH